MRNFDDKPTLDSMKLIQKISLNEQDFEHIVLEKAIESVVEKFAKHLKIMKPAFSLLLQQQRVTTVTIKD